MKLLLPEALVPISPIDRLGASAKRCGRSEWQLGQTGRVGAPQLQRTGFPFFAAKVRPNLPSSVNTRGAIGAASSRRRPSGSSASRGQRSSSALVQRKAATPVDQGWKQYGQR